MIAPTVLVAAKAPVPGRAKTRLAAHAGDAAAAEFAAAAFLDTLDVVGATGWPVVVALSGALTDGARAAALADACAAYRIVPQRGATFAERLVNAHADADGGHGVVQIGTDSPHATCRQLEAVAEGLAGHDASLGLAEDGGWWALGVREARWARPLRDVTMSRPDTGARTYEALRRAGARVARAPRLRDVDTWPDAVALARTAPETRAARVVDAIVAGTLRPATVEAGLR